MYILQKKRRWKKRNSAWIQSTWWLHQKQQQSLNLFELSTEEQQKKHIHTQALKQNNRSMSQMYQSECCALSYSRFVTFPTHESFVFVSILFSSFAWFFFGFFSYSIALLKQTCEPKKGIEHKNNEMQWKIVMTIIATKQLANLMFHWIRIIFLVYECFCTKKNKTN